MARTRIKLILLLGTAAVLGALVIRHTPGLNGPWYWQWHWKRIDGLRLYPAMLAVMAPFFLGQWLHARGRRTAVALGLVMLSTLGLELTAAGMHRRPFDLGSIADAVQHPAATSYFTDAADLLRNRVSFRVWMRTHAERMPGFHLHTRFKPPGLLLYHMAFISLFGATRTAALAAGLFLAVLATVSVAATYALILKLCGDREAAFCGASFFALCPSLVLFLPQFDQVYPALACAMVGLWAAALARGSVRYAVGFGTALALACFISYTFLVLGVFLAGLAFPVTADAGSRALARAVRCAVAALFTAAALYALFWLFTGFDAIGTYLTAARLSAKHVRLLARPYPLHVVFDVLDFALGAGWIGALLVVCFLVAPSDPSRTSPQSLRLALLGLAQVLAVTVLGLLPGESARLLMLMYPLLMIPIGLELAGWTPPARVAVFAALWFLTTALAQNMQFVVWVKG
jgi:hypothetical protein